LGLPNVIDAIVQDFAAEGVPAAVFYGPDHVAEHNSPPRIVVIPTSDSYGAPNYIQPNGFNGDVMADGQNPRPIATRMEGARAIIWAAGAKQSDPTLQQRADYNALHQLINQFVLSLHRVNPGNYSLGRGTTTETTRVDRLGYVYELEFTVNVPITDGPWDPDTFTNTYDTESGVTQQSTIELDFPDLTDETIGPF
jgi:hypothetical protein